MSRVAVIGSCITRDLWSVTGEDAAGLLYVARTSLPSLFAPPVAGFQPAPEPPNGLKRHQHNAVVDDLTKRALAMLVTHRPTHIIFDFIDERFDLLGTHGTLATHSWELEVSGYLSQPALSGATPIARHSAACESLWLEAVGEMAAYLQGTPLRDAVVILHRARWADSWRDPEGGVHDFRGVELWSGRPADIGQHNALLERYQTAFCEAIPHAVQVSAPAPLADATHRWGLSPFHYTDEYYGEIWSQLREAGV